jgi:hypothetical protein
VAINRFRQWPTENKIAVAQFVHGMKNPSKEQADGMKSMLPLRRTSLECTMRSVFAVSAAQVSSFVGGFCRMFCAPPAQTLEFKIVPERSLLSWFFELTPLAAT